jgi:hypothetical protein
MHLAELPPPSRYWLAALPLALLLFPRGEERPHKCVLIYPGPVVHEQPAPPPSACDDPYVGLWSARTHRDEHGDWHEYMIDIRREGDQLRGEMSLRAWPGTGSDASVPECDDGTRMATLFAEIPVEIAVRGSEIRIDAGHARIHRDATCNPVGDYSPDHFVGSLDGRGSLEMVNSDDGGYAHERAYEFVRMTCVSLAVTVDRSRPQ